MTASGRVAATAANHHVYGRHGPCRVGAPRACHAGLERMAAQIEHKLENTAAPTGGDGVADHIGMGTDPP
jgi:hypothetical protein